MVRKIVYSGEGEVLICNCDEEKQLIKDYFTDGGRVILNYDREVVAGVVVISSRFLRVEADSYPKD